MKFSEIKHKIKNLGKFKSLEEIKKAGLRIIRNMKTGDYWLIEEEFLKRGFLNKLIKLRNIAKVRAGIITGNNKLYYKKISSIKNFDQNNFSLVFRTPTDHSKIILTRKDASWIIKVKNIPFKIKRAPILWVDIRRAKHIVHFNKDNLPFEHNFHGIIPLFKNLTKYLVLSLNSTITWLFFESIGRVSISGPIRLLKEDIYELEIPNPILFLLGSNESLYKEIMNREIKKVFTELGFDPNKPIHEQEPNPLPDRKALDDIVFDALGLTEEERKEVYWAVAELVQNRLKKAKSV